MDPELYSRKPAPKPVEELPLWVNVTEGPEPTLEERREASRARKAEVRRLIERSIPVAQRLAALAKSHGVASVDLWHGLKDAQVITGEEEGRSLSWLCRVFPAAGSPKKYPEERRYNPRNGNYGIVHVAPEFARRTA